MPKHSYIGKKSRDYETKDNYFETIVSFETVVNDKRIEEQIKKPNYQGALLDSKVEEMADEYLTNPLLLRFKNRIIIGCLKKNWYVIDGQHRIELAKLLFNSYNIQDKLVFCWYDCSNEKELRDIFISVNHDSIKNQFYVSSDDMKQIIKEEFTGKLKEFNTKHFAKKQIESGRIKTIEEFVIELDTIKFFENVSTSQEAYDKLKCNNQEFYDKTCYEINIINNTSNFYANEIKIIGDRIIFSLKKNNFMEWIIDKSSVRPYHQNRKSKEPITAHKRKAVWVREFGETEDGICPISFCSEILKRGVKAGYHCGHIKSEYNGGLAEVLNMRPICRGCNQSMGSKNWPEWDPTSVLDVSE